MKSVFLLNLLSQRAKWSSIYKLGLVYFWAERLKDAATVKNKIVYFGRANGDKATYVLEQEKDSGSLEVSSKFEAIDYTRGTCDSSFCIYKQKIYFCPTYKYSEVWCLEADTEKCWLYFSK